MKPHHEMITEQQRWLITSALGRPEIAKQAWQQWENFVGNWSNPSIDEGSFRLLPSVYKNLKATHIKTPSFNRLKGVYKQAWIRNVRLFHFAQRELQRLVDDKIPLLLFKGCNLATNYYRDRGARPMSDIDVLVPVEHALHALDILIDGGWQSPFEYSPRDLIVRRNGVNLKHASGAMIDLHRQSLVENSFSNDDESLWKRASLSAFERLPVFFPSAEDELLIDCVHGWRWNRIPSLRWILDATMILRCTGNAFDWNHFLQEAKKRKVSYRCWMALGLLREFDVDVPDDAYNEIGAGPFEVFEIAEGRAFSKPPGLISPFSQTVWYSYIRANGYPKNPYFLITMMRYLFDMRMAPKGWRLVPWLALIIKKRINRFFHNR